MILEALIALLDAGTYTYFDPDKLHVNPVPQDRVTPYVLMQKVSSITYETKGNVSHIDQFRIQFTIVADKMSLADNIAQEIRDEIDGVRDTSISGVDIMSIRYLNEVSEFFDQIDKVAIAVDYECKIKK